MSALPISRVLKDVGPEPVRGSRGKVLTGLSAEGAVRADAEARITEARSLGFAEGSGGERAAGEARLAEQAAVNERSLATERQRWVAEEGQRLADLIVSATGEVESRMADTLARVFGPILIDGVRSRAVAELIETIEGIFSRGELTQISVSGPKDLLHILRDRLASRIDRVTFTPGADCDFKVTANDTILETRMSEWVRAIRGESA